MKQLFLFLSAFLFINVAGVSQGEYEYYIMNSEGDEFDVLGSDDYEMNLSLDQNINAKVKVSVGADGKAENTANATFDAKNTVDANMKTAWLTPANAKHAIIEYIIDLEDVNLNSGTLYSIALFNGWR